MASILLDQNAPKRLAVLLSGHDVHTAFAMGWSQLANGDLITAAEGAGFEILITADKNLRYQQNLSGRAIAVVVLGTNRWTLVRANIARLRHAIAVARSGGYVEVDLA